ncbi:hypothetical protein WOLCODRAFT_33338, partial [Wolfiporia cocos MD-104 SS10]
LHGQGIMITVVDVTGVHHLDIIWCCCPVATSHDLQLLESGLYPASILDPMTAFTFRVLDNFLLAKKECKTSAVVYYSKLRRVTKNAFPYTVLDRYHELLRVPRQWRNLNYCKWHGYGHGTRDDVPPGGLAMFCTACMQPGINLPDGWDNNPVRWKYMQMVIMDGNFTAEHLKMRNPEDDVWIVDRHGFMITPQRVFDQPRTPGLSNPLRPVSAQPPFNCHDHWAVNQMNADRSNLESTGIGATACRHHCCFFPHAVVDFQKGER